jgi:hypothetical protein
MPMMMVMQAAMIVKIPEVIGKPDLFTATTGGDTGIKLAEQ